MTADEEQQEQGWQNLTRIETFATEKLRAARAAHAAAPIVAGSLAGRQHGGEVVEKGRELSKGVADLVRAWQTESLGFTTEQVEAHQASLPRREGWYRLDAVGSEVQRRLRSAAATFARARSLQLQAEQAHAAAAELEQARQARADGRNPDHLAGAIQGGNPARAIDPDSAEAGPQPPRRGSTNNKAAGRLATRLRAGRLAAQRARAANNKGSQ